MATRQQAGRQDGPDAAVAAASMARALTNFPAPPGAAFKTSTGTDELVRVNVPKPAHAGKDWTYNFITPDHVMHKYAPGEQNMRRSIAEAPYSIDNKVEIIGEAE